MMKSTLTTILLCFVSVAVFAGGPAMRTKSKTATKQYEMRNAKFFADPKVWNEQAQKAIAEAPFELVHVDGNAYITAQTVTEYLPTAEFLDNYVEGMKQSAPDLVLLTKEERTVNGSPVLFFAIKGTMNNRMMQFHGYMFSNSKGSTVVYGYSHANIFPELQSDIDTALDGFVPTKK